MIISWSPAMMGCHESVKNGFGIDDSYFSYKQIRQD